VSSITKLDANIEAVILRQSVQWQMNVSIRPGAWVGWGALLEMRYRSTVLGTYETELHSAAKACGCCPVSVGPAILAGAG
jgi:hypothetical protein